MHHQLTRLKQHVVQLEAAVGCNTGSSELGQHASVLSSLAARGTGSSSALERLQQLEKQVEVLSNALASKEVSTSSVPLEGVACTSSHAGACICLCIAVLVHGIGAWM